MSWCKPLTASPARIEAHHRNAQKFTGSRPARGKVLSRLDARRGAGVAPVTTPGATAPPSPSTGSGQALNQEGSLWRESGWDLVGRLDQRFHCRKMPAEATIYMKNNGLRGNLRNDAKYYLIQLKAVTSFEVRRSGKKGDSKMKEGPTMCMKAKENESDILEGPTMFIKTNNLIS